MWFSFQKKKKKKKKEDIVFCNFSKFYPILFKSGIVSSAYYFSFHVVNVIVIHYFTVISG